MCLPDECQQCWATHNQEFLGLHLPQTHDLVAPRQCDSAIRPGELMVSGVTNASPTTYIEHYTPHVQMVGRCQACHVVQHAPLHGLMADSPLELNMQHGCAAVSKRDEKYLVCDRWTA